MKKAINNVILAIIVVFGATTLLRLLLGVMDAAMLRAYLSESARTSIAAEVAQEFKWAKQAFGITAGAIIIKSVLNYWMFEKRAQ